MVSVGHEDMTRVGPSYRQIDHWTRKGWLHADGGGSQGRPRRWPRRERDIAAMMHRMVAVGIPPELAHDVARAGGDHEVAPGVWIAVTPAA